MNREGWAVLERLGSVPGTREDVDVEPPRRRNSSIREEKERILEQRKGNFDDA
jgi:hypothetical protein